MVKEVPKSDDVVALRQCWIKVAAKGTAGLFDHLKNSCWPSMVALQARCRIAKLENAGLVAVRGGCISMEEKCKNICVLSFKCTLKKSRWSQGVNKTTQNRNRRTVVCCAVISILCHNLFCTFFTSWVKTNSLNFPECKIPWLHYNIVAACLLGIESESLCGVVMQLFG